MASVFSPLQWVVIALPWETSLNQDIYDELIDLDSAKEFALEWNGNLFTFDHILKEGKLTSKS